MEMGLIKARLLRARAAAQVRAREGERVIALAGNPNVGKSTVFNGLTGLNQHTGNWTGKTVATAQGRYTYRQTDYLLVDLPGTYSLLAHSAEEEVARDFLCFSAPDAVVVVVDATCLERNLNLVLQTLEITGNVVVCVNLLDEAKKKGIRVDFAKLSAQLGVPVVGTNARGGVGLDRLMEQVRRQCVGRRPAAGAVTYAPEIERAAGALAALIEPHLGEKTGARGAALRMLGGDRRFCGKYLEQLGLAQNEQILAAIAAGRSSLAAQGIGPDGFEDALAEGLFRRAEELCRACVTVRNEAGDRRDRRLDRILTSRTLGIPIMLGLLGVIFWLTLVGANYPSELLMNGFTALGGVLGEGLRGLSAPEWLCGLLVDGMYRTLTWVVAVMLPPMAIFFPLFTLLEDLGYLPRIAFNLDRFFQKSGACGKQALTMCMGFGCNAVGVTGCRIIDSPRERLIAILTNNFVPCNGRMPMMISLITMFFLAGASGFSASLFSTLLLLGVILLGVCMTLLVSRLLSRTLLKGEPSSFALELPPYRRPQVGKVIVRSILDRTLFVLSRAVVVATAAGAVIWGMANLSWGGASLLSRCAGLLDPAARLIGLDGYILLAFLLGFPANEIVIPIVMMSYLSAGGILEASSLAELKSLLVQNGWTWLTAACTVMFSLLHFPCSTTLLTIKKETGSLKWTAAAFLLPTLAGALVCFLLASFVRLFGLA